MRSSSSSPAKTMSLTESATLSIITSSSPAVFSISSFSGIRVLPDTAQDFSMWRMPLSILRLLSASKPIFSAIASALLKSMPRMSSASMYGFSFTICRESLP